MAAEIALFAPADWSEVWPMLEAVFRAGQTYAVARDISEADARRLWTELPLATYVARLDGQIVGTYYIKPNQAGPGDHVCNCGYITSEAARGRSVASEMCRHSLDEAIRRGFRAMQYNLVVSTNAGAVRLWQRHGFEIAGTLPGAFRHPQQGDVDAFVMFKRL